MGANPRPVDFAAIGRGDNSAELALDGVMLPIGHCETTQLLQWLVDGDFEQFIPGMLDTSDRQWLYEQLLDRNSGLSLNLVRQMSCGLISELAQMPWWSAIRLAAQVRQHWMDLDGMLLSAAGLNAVDLPLSRLLNTTYYALAQGLKDDQRSKLERDIFERPPVADEIENPYGFLPGAPDPGPKPPRWTPQEQQASFNAFAAMGAQYGAG